MVCDKAAHSVQIKKQAEYHPESGRLTIQNGRIRMDIETAAADGVAVIRDLATGEAFADGAYIWNGALHRAALGTPQITTTNPGGFTACRKLLLGDLEVEQTFEIPGDKDGEVYETISLINRRQSALDASGFSCGFSVAIAGKEDWRVCEIPFRHHTETGELLDYSWIEFTKKEHWFSTARNPLYCRRTSKAAGAEGWAFYGNGQAFSVEKYNPDSMEWSILSTAEDGKFLRFGGAGRWKMGDPEGAACLQPGSVFSFGTTRYKLMDGDWRQAYAEYRSRMRQKGHVIPPGYDPPVHWNELYNNAYWYSIPAEGDFWHDDFSDKLNTLYLAEHMRTEAKHASDFHCECLYLDPGWDTSFGSNIWDESRMGPMKAFSDEIQKQHGLKLALHTPLAPWSNNESYGTEMRRMDADGRRCKDLCVASRQYIAEKTQRLKKLWEGGAYYLLFDGSWYDGPCYDQGHGHSVPSTRQEHIDAILALQQAVHSVCPGVVIEQHDPVTGPGTPRYAPLYLMHGKKGALDEIWGFEYMNEPLDDIVSRRAYSLFDYNLAYDIPIYLHIDLRKDNEHCMMLWWYASVCRHLGIGGLHADSGIRESQKKAMGIYRKYKRYYALGEFFGIGELTHIHTLAGDNKSVVNCFNTEKHPVKKDFVIKARDAGIATEMQIRVRAEIPAMGHCAMILDWERGMADWIAG
jgi:hypothetical protein